MTFANSCQSDFTFYILPPTKKVTSLSNGQTAEVFDVLKYLEEQKLDYGYEKDDLILTFYDGILQASTHGLSNLFCAGSRYDEDYPCTAAISQSPATRFIGLIEALSGSTTPEEQS